MTTGDVKGGFDIFNSSSGTVEDQVFEKIAPFMRR